MKTKLLYFLLFFAIHTRTQTLNERFHFDYPATIFTSLVSTDSAYYVNGLVVDTAYFPKDANIFTKIGFDGNIEWLRVLNSPNETYETWLGDLIDLQEEGFIINGYGVDSTMHNLILRYNPEGHLIWHKKYRNYFDNEGFARSQGFIPVNNNSFLHLSWETNPQGTNNSDIVIAKIDTDGNIIWQRSYGQSNRRDVPWDGIYKNENAYLISGYQTNSNVVDQNYISRAIIFQVDSLGNKQWEWSSPSGELWDGVNAMVASEDGGLIIASGKGVEEYINPGLNGLYWKNVTILKLNEDREVVWEKDFYPSNRRSLNNSFNQIIASSDNSGFVAVGQYVYLNYDVVDSIGSPAGDFYGFIAKVSSEGDSLWARRLNYVTEIGESQHYIYDISETSDGGYILCGEVKDDQLFDHYQQAWLIKIDEYGCVVPGCHLVNDVEVPERVKPQLLLYPNPVQDRLNVFLKDASILKRKQTALQIINQQGQLLKHFSIGKSDEVTHMIAIDNFPSGTYYLQYLEGHNVLQSKSFIVH